ncbi:MAG: serine/threonine-protein kinase [Terracidiphilus sp.]
MSVPKVIGRYEIVEELGHGAMGSVFKARDPNVGRIVALKTIHSAALDGAQSEEYRARFYREARASGVLAHPGIVPVFDVGEHEGAPFLVMEFVDGRTLADAMKKGERYTLDRVCQIGQQIAEALGYAHHQGVIHRDIKPANILMTSRAVYGIERPRITDFGIAKLAASEITTTGQLLGTPSFMPPEQFTGAPVDGRADLFSLGVILYSLATGEQPFPGETMTAVSYKVVHTDPVPPAKLNPAIPARLEAVILKCLTKSPANRYQTGEELAQDLAAMRTNATASGVQAAAPPAAASVSDVTLGPAPVAVSLPPASTAPSAKPVAPPGPKPLAKKGAKPKKFETIFAVALLAVAGVAAVTAGGWFWLQHRKQPAQQQQQAATAPAPQPAPAPTPTVQGQLAPAAGSPGGVPLTPAPMTNQNPATAPPPTKATPSSAKHPTSKPSAAKPLAAALPPPVAAAAPPPAATPAPTPSAAMPQPPATPVAAAFDPRKLDPNANAKLKIELSKFPNGLPFTVEMNRQPYLHFITGDGASLDDLYVPPGVETFRINLKTGGQEWDSNIVSDDFKAKKRKTLKIQLMENDKAQSKITLPISKDAKLFLSISTPLF